MSLNDLVKVTIVAQTAGVARKNFGVPLIAHYHSVFPERVRTYSEPQEMIDDGFDVGDAAVRAASAIMAQVPRPSSFKVGRMATTPVAHVETLVPTVVVGAKYTVELADNDGVVQTFTYTAESGDTATDICDAFRTAIAAATIDITASGTVTLVLTGDNAGEVFYCYATDDADEGRNWTRTCTNADPGIATDLAAIAAYDPSFFGLIVTNPARAVQNAARTWAGTNRRLLAVTTGDTDLRDSIEPNVGDDFKTANTAFGFVLYSDRPQEFLAAGLMGRQFALNPGSSTYALKTPKEVSSVPLSETHKNNILDANANIFVVEGGKAVTLNGTTGSGEFIDVTHGICALEARLQEETWLALTSNEKLGFTGKDIGVLENVANGVLGLFAGENYNFLDPTSIVITPIKAAAVPAGDRAQRSLKNAIRFSARIQGAIHDLEISGTLTP